MEYYNKAPKAKIIEIKLMDGNEDTQKIVCTQPKMREFLKEELQELMEMVRDEVCPLSFAGDKARTIEYILLRDYIPAEIVLKYVEDQTQEYFSRLFDLDVHAVYA